MHVVCANIFGAIVLKPRFKIDVPSKRVMSSPLEHKTIFFSEFRLGDLMLYVATKFNFRKFANFFADSKSRAQELSNEYHLSYLDIKHGI